MGKGSRGGRGGGSGSGSVRTPVEAKESGRSKQLVKIVEVISEGEIEGLVDGMKSVFLDNTPIQNKDNSYNFRNVSLEGRVGSQTQDVIRGFNASEKEVSVGAQVRKAMPLTRTITDAKVSRLRLTLGVQSLFKQEENGDTNGTTVNLIVFIGNRSYPIAISGKYSSQYLKQYIFSNLPNVPFTVRVERVTTDSTSQRLQNNTIWASYTEIIDTQFTYPNTALIGVKFDSEYFSNIPNRTYDVKGLKVKVPSNYNPATRQYNGMWEGTFKLAWSDNPAWVLYDIITNKRYGLGERVGEMAVDKWTLYQVAQYCDQLVPDGFGGKEPRFTCNAWLTEQRAAYEVINDICSIFRAMPVWNGREFTVVMDRPTDPVWTYTNANVENGEFTYTFSAKKSRHNAIQVEYADKDNAYEKTIEYVSDDESIRKNGLNIKKVTAFGCTSRGQAHRTGLWLLQTEKLETKTVSFTVGAEGLMHTPGDIIKVADVDYAGTNIGGRVLSVADKIVTLDREIDRKYYTSNSYFTYINTQAKHQDIRIVALKGNQITLERTPDGLMDYGVWSLTTRKITSQLFRALSVKEESKGKYTILALQHEPQKEAIVDNGAKFEPRNTSVLQMPTLEHLSLETLNGLKLNWAASAGAGTLTYDIKILKDGNLYAYHKGLTSTEFAFDDLPNGDYTVIIIAKNASGQIVSERSQTFTIDRPPEPRNVQVLGGLGNISISWDWVDDVTMTEIFAAEVDDISQAKRIAKVNAMFFTHEVGAKQVRYYWVRHTRGINVGPFYQQSGLRGESAVDIDAELELLNEKLSKNIIDEVFNVAAPARKLGMMLYGSGFDLNQYQGQKLIYDEKTNKQFLWNGTKYVPTEKEILASAIKGIIRPEQLAPIPTTKLGGKITNAQIGSVSAEKLTGTLSVNQVPTIPTNKLTGQLSAHQISANAIGTNHLSAGAITAAKIAANAITAEKMSVNSVGANAIQADAVTSDKIVANAITSAKIQASAINANHIAAGQISADKMAIGLGGNLLYNPIFANPTNGVPYGWDLIEEVPSANRGERLCIQDPNWGLKQDGYLPNENIIKYQNPKYDGTQRTLLKQRVPLTPNRWYIFSAYMGNRRSQNVEIYLDIRKHSGELVTYRKSCNPSKAFNGINNADRVFIKFKAPSDVIDMNAYFILHNRVANAGHNSAYMFIARPMLEECTEYTQEPSTWQNAGVTAIHGGSIVTNTITAQQIAAGAITANEIAAGAIATRHIATRTITADKIASKSITAEEMSVGSLSAISANLGYVTAGTITGTTISGNTIQGGSISGTTISGTTISGTTINGGTVSGTTISGGTVSGTTIDGGIIRAARLEGVSGKFTGELEVTQLIGGNLCEMLEAVVKVDKWRQSRDREKITYSATIKIKPAPVRRIVFILNSNIYKIVEAHQSSTLSYRYEMYSGNQPPAAVFTFPHGREAKIMVAAYVLSTTRTLSQ